MSSELERLADAIADSGDSWDPVQTLADEAAAHERLFACLGPDGQVLYWRFRRAGYFGGSTA